MKLLKWLSVADRFAKIYLDNQLAPFGINSSQHMYLLKVCNQPGITQDSFLNSFYVHPSNIVRMIISLEKRGLLTRVSCENDKRTWCLYPTKKALEIVEQVNIACARTEAVLTEQLSEEEKAMFEGLLMKAGKQIANELHVERMEDEFDE